MATLRQKKLAKEDLELIARAKAITASSEWNKPKKQASYIYVFKCQEHYKIGYSYRPLKRIESAQTGNPFLLEAVLILPILNTEETQIEAELHKLFDSKRLRGEWFNLDEQDLLQIQSILLEHGKKLN